MRRLLRALVYGAAAVVAIVVLKWLDDTFGPIWYWLSITALISFLAGIFAEAHRVNRYREDASLSGPLQDLDTQSPSNAHPARGQTVH
jgi:peptidoglycan/LPS O-acetylase OafA/YrhL